MARESKRRKNGSWFFAGRRSSSIDDDGWISSCTYTQDHTVKRIQNNDMTYKLSDMTGFCVAYMVMRKMFM